MASRLRAVLVGLALIVGGCAPLNATPSTDAGAIPTPVSSASASTEAAASNAPAASGTPSPSLPLPTPTVKVKLQIVRNKTLAVKKCWENANGTKFVPVCGVVYQIVLAASSNLPVAIEIRWKAELMTYDSCCGDRTLKTYFRKMLPPKELSGDSEISFMAQWDGYVMEPSSQIANFLVPTGQTGGTFGRWELKKDKNAVAMFSVVFDDGADYFSYRYPLKFEVLDGNGNTLVTFLQLVRQ
jgi:hypothetical protein